MRFGKPAVFVLVLGIAVACGGNSTPIPAAPAGPAVDPATAGTITATITFEGTVPPPRMYRLDGDPKCVTENGAPTRADESLSVGPNQALQNVFVYVKDGLGTFGFPLPAKAVMLDQDKCQYTPRVLGVRVGQPIEILNSDPLLHNVRANGVVNQGFNMSTPLEGVSFERTFATKEVMVPFKCDVHAWMTAFVGVLDHPYFGTSAADGKVVLANVPPGTYTLEAWHETLGTRTQQVTIGAKEAKDVAFTFAR